MKHKKYSLYERLYLILSTSYLSYKICFAKNSPCRYKVYQGHCYLDAGQSKWGLGKNIDEWMCVEIGRVVITMKLELYLKYNTKCQQHSHLYLLITVHVNVSWNEYNR